MGVQFLISYLKLRLPSNKMNYEQFRKILKTLSTLIENGVLTTKDIKKEISTDWKFKKDKIINKLELVSRDEFSFKKLFKRCNY